MAPAPRNPRTGCKRRQTRHFTSPKRRFGSLSQNHLIDMRDCEAFGNGCETCVQFGLVLMLASYGQLHENPAYLREVFSRRLIPWIIALWTFGWLVAREYDAALCDIPLWEERLPIRHYGPRFRRLADFLDDEDAEEETGFNIDYLEEMLELFELPEYCRVSRGRLDGKCYIFHREELLIYSLMRMKKGSPANELCKKCGHKCDSRMGKGFKWLLAYLDDRYDHLIGWNGMLLWRPMFPEFAEVIRHYVSQDYELENENTGHIQVIPGVYYPPGTWSVVGLVDAKVYKVCRPHAGPAGPYPGAPRRPWWWEFQRAFWDQHHHVVGVKMLIFLLPNGMYAAVWGPASARRDDAQLVHWSRIDDLLYAMQALYFGVLYKFYGDSKFRVGIWRCIIGRHHQHGGPALTPAEQAEDAVMNRTREKIEHSYGGMKLKFAILSNEAHFKLEKDSVHALRIIRMAHFFYNLHTCCYGNGVSGPNAFNCRPPTMQQYLNM